MSSFIKCKFCHCSAQKKYLAWHYALNHSNHPRLSSVIEGPLESPSLVGAKPPSKKALLAEEKRKRKATLAPVPVPVPLLVEELPHKEPATYVLPRNAIKRAARLKKTGRSIQVVKPYKPLSCPLCGERISRGKMLEHKELIHGERSASREEGVPGRRKQVWVQIVQGGLPGLGKRR
jgi:hypothetical protein